MMKGFEAQDGAECAGGRETRLDIAIINLSQLVRVARGERFKTGKAMKELYVIENGGIGIRCGEIVFSGGSAELTELCDIGPGTRIIDGRGKIALPGFVDPHTHLIFSGTREHELDLKLKGRSYLEILESGGGILYTVGKTRGASLSTLVEEAGARLDRMLLHGTTTAEAKSGYGLDRETEIKQLEVMEALDNIHHIDITKTFLGAHAVPKEYKGKEDIFIDYMVDDVMPEVVDRNLAEFCDIFCEKNVFSIQQSRRLLQKAKDMGLKLKIHADEIVQLGGAELAAELGAVSADHLLQASDNGIHDMARAAVVATLLPGTAFSLKEPYARGRFMIDNNCAVALATDLNPGSCFTESIPLVFSLATLYMNIATEEAVTALTINSAAAIDRANTIGSIDAGKMGDVIILEFPSYKFIPYHVSVNTVEKVVKKGDLVFDKTQGGIIRC